MGLLLNLREPHATSNMFASLPMSVEALGNLQQLDLRGNPLTNSPESIGGLPSLQKLGLRGVESLDLRDGSTSSSSEAALSIDNLRLSLRAIYVQVSAPDLTQVDCLLDVFACTLARYLINNAREISGTNV